MVIISERKMARPLPVIGFVARKRQRGHKPKPEQKGSCQQEKEYKPVRLDAILSGNHSALSALVYKYGDVFWAWLPMMEISHFVRNDKRCHSEERSCLPAVAGRGISCHAEHVIVFTNMCTKTRDSYFMSGLISASIALVSASIISPASLEAFAFSIPRIYTSTRRFTGLPSTGSFGAFGLLNP